MLVTVKGQRIVFKMSLYLEELIFVEPEVKTQLELGESYRTLNLYPMILDEKSVTEDKLKFFDLWQEHRFV